VNRLSGRRGVVFALGAAALAGLVAALVVVPTGGGPAVYERVGETGSDGPVTVVAEDGASITVPAEAARAGAEIRAEVLEPEDAPPLPEYATEYLAVWDFDVAGGLDAPVTLRLPASDLDELWVLAHYVDGEWRPAGFEIDGDEIVVEAESLSLWGKLKSGITWVADGVVSITSDVGNWLKEQGESLLRGIFSLPEPIRCKDPDATVTVELSRGQRMMSACADRGSPDPLLRVQNDRTFWVQICALDSDGRMDIMYPTRLLSDCPADTVGGMLLSSGHRAGYVSGLEQPFDVHASFGTVPQLVTMIDWIVRLIPGLSSVELPAVARALRTVVDDLQRIPELAQAISAAGEGDVLRAFKELLDAAFGGNALDKIEAVLIRSGLLRQLGANVLHGVLKEAAIVADLVGVTAGIIDIWWTRFSSSGFTGMATFASQGRAAAAKERNREQEEVEEEDELEQEAEQQEAAPVMIEIDDSVAAYAHFFCPQFTLLAELVFADLDDGEIRRDAEWGAIRRELRDILDLAAVLKPPPSMVPLHTAATAVIEAAIAYSERYDDDDLFIETYDFGHLIRDPRFLLTMLPLGDAIFAISEEDEELLAENCPGLSGFDETTLGPEFDDGELRIREQGFWSLGEHDRPSSGDGEEMSAR